MSQNAQKHIYFWGDFGWQGLSDHSTSQIWISQEVLDSFDFFVWYNTIKPTKIKTWYSSFIYVDWPT